MQITAWKVQISNHIITRTLALCFILCLVTPLNPQYAEAGRTVRAGIFNFKPLVIFDQKSRPTGFIVDILNHIAQQEEWNVEYVPGTWQESLERLRTDKIDIILCIGYSAERDEYLDFPKEHVLLDWGLVYRKKGSSINTILDMEGKTIAAMKASIYTAGFKNTLEQFDIKSKIVEKTEVKDVFGALESGEVDAAISSTIAGLSFESSQKIDRSPVVFTPVKLGYAVNSGKNADLAATIDKRLAELKSDKNSYYYNKLDKCVTARSHSVPKELYWIIGGISGILFVLIVFVFILKWQVRAKTNSLKVEIEQRTLALEAFRQSREDLDRAQQVGQIGSWRMNTQKNELIWSDENYRIFGIPKGTPLTYESFQGITHPDDRQYVDTHWQAALRGEPYDIEHRLVVEGQIKWVREKAFLEYDETGSALGGFGITQDITERKLATEELRISEERNRQIIHSSIDGFWRVDTQARLIEVNDAYCRMSGYSREELLTMVVPDLEVLESSEDVAARIRRIVENGSDRFTTSHRRKDGRIFEVEVSIQYRSGEDGGEFAVFLRDVTEKRHLESQLRQAQKLEAIGTLAGGIAHDFNNILGAIVGYSEIIRDDFPPGSPSIHDINQVIKASHRAKDLVKQILAFSRQGEDQKIAVQPAAIVKEAIILLRSSLPTTITIKQDIDPDAGIVLADPTQIHQIVMNLSTNAFHAMEVKGGTLTIALQKKILSKDDLATEPDLQPGTFMQLTIRDTGEGILPDVREKIFDPFFTTKEIGKGTGLGLSTVYSIVNGSGGSIACDSQLGEGTEFRILLPALEDHAVEENESAGLTPHGKEHILLIDDEEILVELGQAMLERLGYHVTTRRNSLDALATFQNQPDTFDLIITDQTMPGMTGVDLARRILQIRPRMPIILSTGYSSQITEDKAKAAGIKGLAFKPLAKKDIGELIRKVLDGKSP